jgi:hypothetical protein
MGRYLVIWEINNPRLPEDAQERAAAFKAAMQAVQAGIDSGMIKEWGAFLGLEKGFGVYEGSEVEVAAFLQQFAPWASDKVIPYVTAAELSAMVDAMMD